MVPHPPLRATPRRSEAAATLPAMRSLGRRLGVLGLGALLGACAASSREADRPYSRGLASVESLAVVSDPTPQSHIRVIARGTLPDACTRLHGEERERRGHRVEVTLTTRREAGALCPEAPQTFTKPLVIPIAELFPGLYTLDVNGVRESFEVLPHDQLHEDLHERELE